MRWTWTVALLAALLSPLSALATANADTDAWPGYRAVTPSGALPDSFGLVEVWKRELGAGYSSLAVSDGLVVTLHTAGDDDVLAAFDATSGEPTWQLRLDSKYAGHDGSDDGPLASPTIVDGHVYALGAKGQLVAATLQDGEEVWRVQLDASNSSVPFYGYTASPLAVGDLIIMLAGGEGRAVTAYDRKNGELRWSVGDDSVTYQSPILAELGGRQQIVAVTDQWAYGLEPTSGKQLWSFQHSTGNAQEGSAHPTQIDDQHLLINLSNEALALRVSADGTVEEAWRSRAFANALVLPVVYDGTLFGFTGRILSAVDGSNGEFLWRTRGAQAQNLSLIDGHLAMITGDGDLVLVEAGGDDYVEVARLAVFETGDYADPAYASGHIFVRNQSHLAAVRVDAGVDAEVAEAVADPYRYLGQFGSFVREVEKLPAAERQAKIDAYFANVTSTPIVQRDGSAHIIYRGDAEDVGLEGTVLGWDSSQTSLHRVADTDLFYRSLKLDPAGAYDYQLSVDYGQADVDAANPLLVDQGFRQISELRMPDFRANAALEAPADDAPKGSLHEFRFQSQALENARNVQVWTPPGFSGDARYPLLVVNHGNNALTSGRLQNVLDNLVGRSVEPIVVAFVPRASGAEYNGDQAPAYAKFLVDELVPHLERHYQTSEERAIMGPGSGAVIALHTAMAFPGSFQQVALQSFYLTDSNRDGYLEMLAESDATPRVWIESGPNDYQLAGPGIGGYRSSKALAETLEAKGVPVEMQTVHGTAGWVAWRAQTDLILEAFFPPEGDADS